MRDSQNEPITKCGQYAGFLEWEWLAYAEDRYRFSPPPVSTVGWDHEAWMHYLRSNWTRIDGREPA